jgi:hypothetical protein
VPDYRSIGRIIRLQIQTSSLKVYAEPRRYYTPEPIRHVDALDVDEGRIAAVIDGREVVDVHSAVHPASRNRGNGNMLSVVFTGHYAIMRQKFGEHLADGVAGENMLVDYDARLNLSDLENGLVIQNARGDRLELGMVSVAHPCVEFSRFSLDNLDASPQEVSQTLRFLEGGTRGFYGVVTSPLPARIEVGDRLLARV